MQTGALAPVDWVLRILVIIESCKDSDESFQGEDQRFGALIRDNSLSSVSSHWIWNAATNSKIGEIKVRLDHISVIPHTPLQAETK